MNRRISTSTTSYIQKRIQVVLVITLLVIATIILRLFVLQVLSHKKYNAIAESSHAGSTELPARRGEILIKDYNSDEEFRIATNSTLDLIFADPTQIDEPKLIAETLAPIVFRLEDEQKFDEERMKSEEKEALKIEDEEDREKTLEKIKPKSEAELAEDFKEEIEEKISQKTREAVLFDSNLEPSLIEKINDLNLPGIEITEDASLYFYPAKIGDKSKTASKLAAALKVDKSLIERLLEGKNRYTILQRKLTPQMSRKIEKIMEEDTKGIYIGIGLQEEYYRYYPEGQLGAQVLGYVDGGGTGQYGVENYFDNLLAGKKGYFASQTDALGNPITVGKSVIKPAEDGANITLTLDRSIQLEVEKILERGVKEYRADDGTALVIDPKTGRILAMAQYPTFDPNVFAEIYETTEIDLNDEEIERVYNEGTDENPKYYFYVDEETDERIEVFPDPENGDGFLMYKNKLGPEVYKNLSVVHPYEPGSVFKPVAMSAALDAREVTPNTTFNEESAITVDEFTIKNFNDQYHGLTTMTEVLERSSNIGMSWIAKKLGKNLLYNYITAFGFGERSDIGLSNEQGGEVEYWEWWAESELLTKAFGQGLTVTPLQIGMAYSALANEGILMEPHIVEKVEYPDGKIEINKPKNIRRAVRAETASTISAMLVSTIENGIKNVALPTHYLAGKSGTAQTYKYGKAQSGPGTTIVTFAGFAPIDDPQFVIVVKFTKPKTIEWGARTAGPTFQKIADFLFTYYNIPPDKKTVNLE